VKQLRGRGGEPEGRSRTGMSMTPRGRAALVLGFVLVIGAIVAGTVEVRVGQHGCGSAVSAHAPVVRSGGRAESRIEDQCDRKITDRRWLVGVVGVVGVVIAIAGAYDHDRWGAPGRRSGPG
jgi:hypothetical protein